MYKNMTEALYEVFEEAIDTDFWGEESILVGAYAELNGGEQLDCEMKSTAISEDADGKNMVLSVFLGNKEYKVNIHVYDAETGKRLYEDE